MSEEENNEIVDTPEDVQRASMRGWMPKEDWVAKGRAENTWRPAKEFLSRSEELMPILKSENRKLESQLLETNKKLAEQGQLLEKMGSIQSKFAEDAHNERMNKIRGDKLAAAKEGDMETYTRLDAEERNIKPPEKFEVKADEQRTKTDSIHPAATEFSERNASWFGADAEMTRYAQYVADGLANNKDPLSLPGNEAGFFKKVEESVKAAFSHKFTNANQNFSAVDETDTRGATQSNNGKKTFNDLPQEAKAQCKSLMNEMKMVAGRDPERTKAEYVKEYFGE